MKHDTEYRKIFEDVSSEQVVEMNRQNDEEHQRQAEEFKAGYIKGLCYLCNKPFKTISTESPCLHWLLRRCKFRKKDFPKIYKKYSYGNIAAFIRWCANEERFLSNINDLGTACEGCERSHEDVAVTQKFVTDITSHIQEKEYKNPDDLLGSLAHGVQHQMQNT